MPKVSPGDLLRRFVLDFLVEEALKNDPSVDGKRRQALGASFSVEPLVDLGNIRKYRVINTTQPSNRRVYLFLFGRASTDRAFHSTELCFRRCVTILRDRDPGAREQDHEIMIREELRRRRAADGVGLLLTEVVTPPPEMPPLSPARLSEVPRSLVELGILEIYPPEVGSTEQATRTPTLRKHPRVEGGGVGKDRVGGKGVGGGRRPPGNKTDSHGTDPTKTMRQAAGAGAPSAGAPPAGAPSAGAPSGGAQATGAQAAVSSGQAEAAGGQAAGGQAETAGGQAETAGGQAAGGQAAGGQAEAAGGQAETAGGQAAGGQAEAAGGQAVSVHDWLRRAYRDSFGTDPVHVATASPNGPIITIRVVGLDEAHDSWAAEVTRHLRVREGSLNLEVRLLDVK
jgi:hypothetical protein